MTEHKTKKGKHQKMAEAGVAAQQYTANSWFVRIYPCLKIEKYLFSFAKKGEKGKGFNVYMDIEELELWVDDILDVSKTFLKTILAEKKANEKYPKTYKYTTGEKASKSIGIGPSSSENGFAVINGSALVDDKKVFANVPVDYNWLRKFAKEFRRETVGYFRKMADLTLKSAESYNRRDFDDEDDSTASDESSSSPVSSESVKPDTAKETNSQKDNESISPAQANKPQQTTEAPKVEQQMDKPFCEYLKSTVRMAELNNNILVIKGVNKENKERIVYFMPQECSAAGNEFLNFKKMAEQRTGVGFNILMTPENGKLRFTKFMVG